jgi:hypothetical protein
MLRPSEDLLLCNDLISVYLDHSSEIKNPDKKPKSMLAMVRITPTIPMSALGNFRKNLINQNTKMVINTIANVLQFFIFSLFIELAKPFY